MHDGDTTETAWGRWVRRQPPGVLTEAMLATGIAYSTIHKARKRRVSLEIAEELSRFTKGAVKAADMARVRKKLPAKLPRKRARRSAA